jgi:hypothetical protein
MTRKLEHLELTKWQKPLRRRLSGGGRALKRENKSVHGRQLIQQARQVSQHLQTRVETAPQGINPKLIFKLQLHQRGNLNEEELKRLGLRMLARDAKRAIVVFPDEATLGELRRRLEEYAGLVPDGHQYANLAAIDGITELTAADRIGPRLRAHPLLQDETAALDIELWHGYGSLH